MKKLVSRFLILAMALGVSTLAFADDQKSMTGYVTETHCGAKGAKAEHADCAVKCVKEGAKWALYNPEDKSMFVLSGDDAMMAKMASMAGKKVTVKGTMNKEKKEINVATMEQGP
jgi:Flp pilus assembly protein TadD